MTSSTYAETSIPKAASQLPPGPRFIFPIHFFYEPDAYLARCAARYGDVLTIPNPFGGRDVLLGSPETVRALFTADPDLFEVALVELSAPLIGSDSLILQSGQRHRQERKLMTPPFHGERMRAYGELMAEITERHIARWQPGRPFPVLDTTQAISLEVILRAVFGVETDDRVARVRDAVLDYVNAFSPLLVFFPALRRDFAGLGPWARFCRAKQALDQLLYGEIDRRGAGPPGEDILSLLLSARYDDGSAFTREQVHDQLITLLFAGHETTAISLAWALYFLHRHPDVLARLRAELRALGDHPAPEAIAENPLLGAVCHETLRLRPLLPILPIRRLRRPFQVGGYTLPPGMGVTASPGLLHRRPDLYPQPDRFQPERFLRRAPAPFEFLVFGGGARRCLGAAFALYEMKIVLATVLLRCNMRLAAPARRVREVRRNLTMGPLGGIPMVLESRVDA